MMQRPLPDPLAKPDPFAALTRVPLDGWRSQPVPPDWASVVDDARDRVERFTQEQRAAGRRIPAFVGSDAKLNHQLLAHVVAQGLAPGPRFCEWGSGFGLATCAAAHLGFDATGIEIEAELVARAQQLAAHHGIAARFVQASYRPPSVPPEADLVFVYPWPAEERMVAEVFTRSARPGTLLALYRGGLQFALWRQPG